jgi:hypothetical protein
VDDPLMIATAPLLAFAIPPAALDNVKAPLALPATVAAPEDTKMAPLLPTDEAPLLNTSLPLAPSVPLLADFIVTTPEE